MRPRIFISHSTNGIDEHRQVLLDLVEYLKDDFIVFADIDQERGLKVGDPWRKKLLHELWRTQGGIVLLSEKATKSPWVYQEASLLRLHNFQHSTVEKDAFPLLFVKLDDFDKIEKALKEHRWSPMDILELQMLPSQGSVLDVDYKKEVFPLVKEKLTKSLVENLCTARASERYELHNKVYQAVKELKTSEPILDEFVQINRDENFLSGANIHEDLSQIIFIEGLAKLAALFEHLNISRRERHNREIVRDLLYYMSPYWVPPDQTYAIKNFVLSSLEKKHTPVCILPSKLEKYTPAMYLRQLCFLSGDMREDWRALKLHFRAGYPDEIIEQIRDEVSGKYLNMTYGEQETDYNSLLYFVVLPRGLPNIETTTKIIAQEFPHLGIIILMDSQDENEKNLYLPLEAAYEESKFREYNRLKLRLDE
jgi:hypothetical protein